jgi:hypothetical protein
MASSQRACVSVHYAAMLAKGIYSKSGLPKGTNDAGSFAHLDKLIAQLRNPRWGLSFRFEQTCYIMTNATR